MATGADTHTLRIGPAGWSYRDWIGPVYPRGTGIDQLRTIAGHFNCIELNSSFYRIPPDRLIESWKRRLATIADFTFSVKVWQKITHERNVDEAAVAHFIHTFDPLIETGLVGAFLLQFPWSFRDVPENRRYLSRLGTWFRDIPAAVELRHGSWNNPDTLKLLGDRHLAFCNIDQPLIGNSLPPTGYVTDGELAYIRLHGRNRNNWFNEKAGRDERYDYLYSERELDEWHRRALQILGSVRNLFIITNNHFQGQALVNAFQLKSKLERRTVAIMPELVASYPVLENIAAPGPGQGRLL
ncbi:MAG TPA: DUF72 domain-containing protein [Patescibacteria group bacterium]|nr:DUF72 domain-containing protein [Patescibacteria group bacterium]